MEDDLELGVVRRTTLQRGPRHKINKWLDVILRGKMIKRLECRGCVVFPGVVYVSMVPWFAEFPGAKTGSPW